MSLNLSELPSSIEEACTHALGHYHNGTLGEYPSFMLSIDCAGLVRVEYLQDVEDLCARPFVFIFDVLIPAKELRPVLDTVAGLGLCRAKEIERMTVCVLAHLNGTIYKMHNRQDAVLELAATLDMLNYKGLVSYCQGQQRQRLMTARRPELN